MKAYKGFNRDMTCRGFQFEEGKTYECDEAKLCEKGFHACLDPLDCYKYYAPGTSVYHEVEIDEISDDSSDASESDSKIVGRKITIGRELNTDEIHDIHLEVAEEKIINAGDSSSVNVGDRSGVKAGGWSSIKAGGWSSIKAGCSSSVKTGDSSSVKAGDSSSVNTGCASSANTGSWSSVNAGYSSSVKAGEASEIYSYADSRYCAGINSVFACFYGGKVCTAVVDGEKIMPEVWYVFKDGEFVREDEA